MINKLFGWFARREESWRWKSSNFQCKFVDLTVCDEIRWRSGWAERLINGNDDCSSKRCWRFFTTDEFWHWIPDFEQINGEENNGDNAWRCWDIIAS